MIVGCHETISPSLHARLAFGVFHAPIGNDLGGEDVKVIILPFVEGAMTMIKVKICEKALGKDRGYVKDFGFGFEDQQHHKDQITSTTIWRNLAALGQESS